MDFLEQVRDKARIKILFLPHAVRQMSRSDRRLTTADVRAVVESGCLLEEYPEDPRGHSGLLLGWIVGGRPVHVVCAPKSEYLGIITAYIPDEQSWIIDFTTRRKR